MEKITLTRGLVQLKLLDKRINKHITEGCFVDFKIGNTKQKPNCNPQSALDKVTDLIQRRELIKSAIMRANATTKVKINKEEMTIMEAIEKKNSINYLLRLKDELRNQHVRALNEIRYQNDKVQDRLDKQLEAMAGKDGKIRDEEVKAFTQTFKNNNEAVVIDPIKIQEKIDELDEYIDGFLSEVDLVLSEANSQTLIEI